MDGATTRSEVRGKRPLTAHLRFLKSEEGNSNPKATSYSGTDRGEHRKIASYLNGVPKKRAGLTPAVAAACVTLVGRPCFLGAVDLGCGRFLGTPTAAEDRSMERASTATGGFPWGGAAEILGAPGVPKASEQRISENTSSGSSSSESTLRFTAR